MFGRCHLMRRLAVPLVVAALGVPGVARGAADLRALVAYWPFEEGEGAATADVTGNGHEGVIDGGYEWVDGKFGKALEFNGVDGFVDVPTMAGMAAFDHGTIEFWAKLETWADFDNLLGTQALADNRNTIRFERADDFLAIYQGDDFGAYDIRGSLRAIKVNTWTHLAYVWAKDLSLGTVYVDGFKGAGPVSHWPEEYAAMRIGTGYQGRWTHGVIDEVRMWSAALTQEEIQANMTKGVQDFLAVSPRGRLATNWARIRARI